MIPDAPFRANTTFTIYENWTDLYELRYNQDIGEPANFTALQFSDASIGGQGADGPGDRIVANAQRASGDSRCSVVEAEPQLRLCVYAEQSYLVRSFAVDGRKLTVVAHYFDNPDAALGNDAADRTVFNPDSIEGLVMSASFTALAPAEAAETHLEVVN